MNYMKRLADEIRALLETLLARKVGSYSIANAAHSRRLSFSKENSTER